MPKVKYYADELEEAVQKLQGLGDYDKEIDASRKAGEILLAALNEIPVHVQQEIMQDLSDAEPVVDADPGSEWGLGVDRE